MVFGARKGGNTVPLITNTKTKLLPNAALKFRKLNRGPLIIKTSSFFYISGGGGGGTFYIRGKRLGNVGINPGVGPLEGNPQGMVCRGHSISHSLPIAPAGFVRWPWAEIPYPQ